MLQDLALLQEPYVYEIVVHEIEFHGDIIRCGKSITIFKNTYRVTNYNFGKKHGTQILYDYDGTLIERFAYKNGVLHGSYYMTGKLGTISGKYIKNKRHQLWKYNFPNGGMKTIKFIGGDLHGFVKEYYNTGVLRLKGREIRNKRVGKWRYYDCEGYKSKTEFYENDKLIKGITYYVNGCKKLEVIQDLTIEYDNNGYEIGRYYERGVGDLFKIKMEL